jgi:hypothetical protein
MVETAAQAVHADSGIGGFRHVRLAPPGRASAADRTIWSISGSHVIMIGMMSMGQFALGGICV